MHIGDEVLVKFNCLAYNLWHRCNKVVFEEFCRTNEQVLDYPTKVVVEFGHYAKKFYRGARVASLPSSKLWLPSTGGCIKVNSDASVSEDGWVELGIVARDYKGDAVFTASCCVTAHWPVVVANGKALCLAIKLARAHDIQDVIFETDCVTIKNCLTRDVICFSDLDTVLEDPLTPSRDFISVFCSHVLRDDNYVAHHLPRYIPFGVEQRWERHCPAEVSPYVLMDGLSDS